jgi:hypothetical protein
MQSDAGESGKESWILRVAKTCLDYRLEDSCDRPSPDA